MKRTSFLGIAVGLCAAVTAQAATLKITIRNLSPTDGTLITPVWVGFHDGGFDLYDIGSPASPGLERLAEDGNTAPLSAEFAASGNGTVDTTIPGPGGPLAPGEMGMTTLTLDGILPSSRYFSYASMVIPSNDAFIANGDPTAFEIFDAAGNFLGADFIVLGSAVRDAGTEVNDEIPANTAALMQTVADTGVMEMGTVQNHGGFIPGGNILTARPGADFTASGYQVAHITVEAVPEPGEITMLIAGLLVGGVLLYRRRRLSAELPA